MPKGNIPIVDKEICIACAVCAHVCPERAIIVIDIPIIDPQKCVGCGVCAVECPTEAISLTEPKMVAS